jgi:hypothetical protein
MGALDDSCMMAAAGIGGHGVISDRTPSEDLL